MKVKGLVLGICLLFFCSLGLFSQKAIILKQEDSPIKITSYKPYYFHDQYHDSILHDVKYLNSSEKKIVAFRFSFVAFDAFNEFLDKFGGVGIDDIAINKEASGSWEQSAYHAFLFKKFGTGIVYVDAVRFEDETFWKVKEADILPQIQELEEGFTADLLKEKKGEIK
jgi:hypothetical protein